MIDTSRIDNWTKALHRMVKDPDGQELLRELLGVRISKADPNQPVLHVLMPSYGKPDMLCIKALEVAIAEARKVATIHAPWLFGHSIVHWVRNEMIAGLYQRNQDFTHVLFIDDDIEIAPDAIVRLLSHK